MFLQIMTKIGRFVFNSFSRLFLREKIGEAYAFLQYEGKKEDIKNRMDQTINGYKSRLEIELSKIDELNVKGDEALAEKRADAKEAGLNYVIKANLAGKTNLETANELGVITQGIYYHLYDGDKSKFYCRRTCRNSKHPIKTKTRAQQTIQRYWINKT